MGAVLVVVCTGGTALAYKSEVLAAFGLLERNPGSSDGVAQDSAARSEMLLSMTQNPARVVFSRVRVDGKTAWDTVYEGSVIARVQRVPSFGRAYSKSQMGTRHIMVWQSSVMDVPGLSDAERRAVQRELKGRDKTSREMTVPHIFASYERAGVQLPVGPVQQAV